MNKDLFNWLDKVEGLEEGTTVKNIEKELNIQGKQTDNILMIKT